MYSISAYFLYTFSQHFLSFTYQFLFLSYFFLFLIHRILLLLQWHFINFNFVRRCRLDRINLKLIAKTSTIRSETLIPTDTWLSRQFALEQVYRIAEKNARTHRSSVNNGVCIKYVSSRYRKPTCLVNSLPFFCNLTVTV